MEKFSYTYLRFVADLTQSIFTFGINTLVEKHRSSTVGWKNENCLMTHTVTYRPTFPRGSEFASENVPYTTEENKPFTFSPWVLSRLCYRAFLEKDHEWQYYIVSIQYQDWC